MSEAGAKAHVLLLGASGFIGARLLDKLLCAGYRVTCGARKPPRVPRCRTVIVDYNHDWSESDWLPRLTGIDVVINAVGILRETHAATFAALHVAAPRALFRACVQAGVKKVIQISALGADSHAATGYHRSKKQADDELAALPLPSVIVQPSLVFGEGGASTKLFTTLAALPLVPTPGNGAQCVQPVHIDDLAEMIVRLLETSSFDHQRIAVVGPRPLTLQDYLRALRRAMGLGEPCFLHVPMSIVRAAAALGDRVPRTLLDRDALAMLVRGNVASADTITAVLGRAPRRVEAFIKPLSARAIANDARLAWLLPLLRFSIALVWIVTGIVSLGLYPVGESYALLARVGLVDGAASIALYGAALLDLAFGVGIVVMRQRKWLWRAQMLLIVIYTVIITIYLPEFWLHPYGPVLKNLPLLAAIGMLHELEQTDERASVVSSPE
jgi:uncharacterized protein YbjT (DUF2867 family)